MKKRSHWELSKYVAASSELKGVLRRFMFCFGSIYPDINVLTFIRGHIYSTKQKKIKSEINLLSRKSKLGIGSMFRLGIVTHYMADFFTYPHTPKYSGSIIKHYYYEKKLKSLLHRYLLEDVSKGMTTDIFFFQNNGLDYLYNSYINTRYSPEQDCEYIIFSVTYLVHSICNKIP